MSKTMAVNQQHSQPGFLISLCKTSASYDFLLICLVFIWLTTTHIALASGTTVISPLWTLGNYTLVLVATTTGKNFNFDYRADATSKGKAAFSSFWLILTVACKKTFSAIDAEISLSPIYIGKSETSTDHLYVMQKQFNFLL
jgi:hypothetical protein